MRTLLDVEGSLETARSRDKIGNAEDRRIDQVVGELGRYGVVVAGINGLGRMSTELERALYLQLEDQFKEVVRQRGGVRVLPLCYGVLP